MVVGGGRRGGGGGGRGGGGRGGRGGGGRGGGGVQDHSGSRTTFWFETRKLVMKEMNVTSTR